MRVGAIIQARMNSSRLPGKIMLDLCGKPIIQHIVERLRLVKSLDEIVIATTVSGMDDAVALHARKNAVKCYRGSEEDVLARFYHAAGKFDLDAVMRVTADCPLIDPVIADEMILFFRNNRYDMVTNSDSLLKQRNYPRGLDIEIFSFKILEEAFKNAIEASEREHVTLYMEKYGYVYCCRADADYMCYRWTVDTEKDFELIKAIYGYLYRGRHDFFFNDILNLYKKHPELAEINSVITQKNI